MSYGGRSFAHQWWAPEELSFYRAQRAAIMILHCLGYFLTQVVPLQPYGCKSPILATCIPHSKFVCLFVFVDVLRPHRHCIDHLGGGLRPCLSGPTRAVRDSTSQQKNRDNREKSAPRGRQNSNSRPLRATAKRLAVGP